MLTRAGWAALLLAVPALTACASESLPPGLAGQPGQHTTRADGAQWLYSPDRGGSAQNPAFSRDGRSLVFTLFHGGYNQGAAGG